MGQAPVAAAIDPAATPRFEPAFVEGVPESTCLLHPEGSTAPKDAVHVTIDDDGVARFLALRATAPTSVQRLSLDCTDPSGIEKIYTVDLRSDATFAPHPFDPVRAGLEERPALTGDPRAYTDSELIRAGYGLRPDPDANPHLYEQWLASARLPAHKARAAFARSRALAPLPAVAKLNVITRDDIVNATQAPWTGAVLSGIFRASADVKVPNTYLSNTADFTVPAVNPAAVDNIGSTNATLWNGLSLPQNNQLLNVLWVETSAVATSYLLMNECSDAIVGDTLRSGTFAPAPGDEMFSEVYFCQPDGRADFYGLYGCTSIVDLTQKITWDCNQANSPSCPSYQRFLGGSPVYGIGESAEFILQNEDGPDHRQTSGPWPLFAGTVKMQGSATYRNTETAASGTVDVNSDPYTVIYQDYTPSTNADTMKVSLTSNGSVNWDVCVRKTCQDYASGRIQSCGALSDGCGGTLACGCSGDDQCENGECVNCTPRRCVPGFTWDPVACACACTSSRCSN